jgi:hypothetical protein
MPVFTFGAGHECPQCRTPLGNSFVELPSRDAMVALFGIKWSHEYRSQQQAGVSRYHLQRVTPGACACGRLTACIGCGVVVGPHGNICDKCEVD